MNQADELLVEAACSGDQKALSQLLAACQPDLKRFARRACSTSEDAEDAVQIALWQLQRKIGTLRTVTAFAGWLFRIVERECYRLFKVSSRTDPLSESFDYEIATSLTDNALQIDLARSITSLPEVYRTILILRDIGELTSAEVADKLDISIEAVKSRLHRARTLVREALNKGGYPMHHDKSHSELESGD